MRPYSQEEARRAFWAKVNQHGPVAPGIDTPCWEWTGAKDKDGHGTFRGFATCYRGHPLGQTAKVGRLALLLTEGREALPPRVRADGVGPDDILVGHLCHNASCVRPDHLVRGVPKTHTDRLIGNGRMHFPDPTLAAKGDSHGSRTRPDRRPRGEANPKSKVTATGVLAILQMAADGRSTRAIAAAFCLTTSSVRAIVKGTNWPQVHAPELRARISVRLASRPAQRPWSTEEDKLLRALWPTHSGTEVANALGRTERSVMHRRRLIGLVGPKP